LQPPFRSKQEVIIDAPLESVWSFSMDLTKIPEFHLRVVKVDLPSGKSLREPGVSYRCHRSGGKHTCIEKDIEIIPLQKIVSVLPEDTFGISKILGDYRVETTFQTLDHTFSKGALMMTSCLDRNGGGRSCLQIVDELSLEVTRTRLIRSSQIEQHHYHATKPDHPESSQLEDSWRTTSLRNQRTRACRQEGAPAVEAALESLGTLEREVENLSDVAVGCLKLKKRASYHCRARKQL